MIKTSFKSILLLGIVSLMGITYISFSMLPTSTTQIIFAFATSSTPQQQLDEPLKIAAGGGNFTAPYTLFAPDEITVNAGQAVTWYNPTEVAEPHTVTFIFDNSTNAGVVSPLSVSNTTKFTALPPNSNNEPILIPDKEGMNTLIALNARTFNPTIIDSSGNVKFMNPNAKYTITGNEKYVNSGWFLPKGQEQNFPGSGNTFTVTFQKPGVYNYMCILHPWMTGSITVK